MADHQQQIAELMSAMGWTDGTFVPIANDENKLLMERMQHFTEEKEHKVQLERQYNDRLQRLTKNLTNTQQGIQENSVTIIISVQIYVNDNMLNKEFCRFGNVLEIVGGASVTAD